MWNGKNTKLLFVRSRSDRFFSVKTSVLKSRQNKMLKSEFVCAVVFATGVVSVVVLIGVVFVTVLSTFYLM